MNYEETLDYLYNSLPMFSRMGSAAYKKDLTNIIILCETLSDPQNKFRSLHVAGTNGKGSTSHMLAAVLASAGYKTGLYTSPHVYDFRERIRIDGEMIDKVFVIDFVRRIKPLADEIQPSFFEITVAMAFEYFALNKVDYAVVEVGLGGRLDSTNIITPELSVITNIGMDHMNLLGDNLVAIAGEKAGIIKDGVPVVIGERQEAVENVFNTTAASHKAPIYFASDNFQVLSSESGFDKIFIEVGDRKANAIQNFTLDLPGIYQRKNLLTVLQSLKVLSLERVTTEIIHKAIANTKKLTGLHGRWEMISKDPVTILEVAHNGDGIAEMLKHINSVRFHHLHLVIGMVNDKDPTPLLEKLPKQATYYFTRAMIPRALPEKELQEKAEEFQLEGNCYEDVNEALHVARASANADDLIIVCGSIFLVAEVKVD